MSAPSKTDIFNDLQEKLFCGKFEEVNKILSDNPDLIKDLDDASINLAALNFITQACKYQDTLSIAGIVLDRINIEKLSEKNQALLFCEIVKEACPSAIQYAFETKKFNFNKKSYFNTNAFAALCHRSDINKTSEYHYRGITMSGLAIKKPSNIDAVIFAIDCGNIIGLENMAVRKFVTTALKENLINPKELCDLNFTSDDINPGLARFFAQSSKIDAICESLRKGDFAEIVDDFLKTQETSLPASSPPSTISSATISGGASSATLSQ